MDEEQLLIRSHARSIMLLVYIFAGGAVAAAMSDVVFPLALCAAAGYMLMPIVLGVAFIYEHTYVTHLVSHTWFSLAGTHSFNDVIYTGVQNVCPNGSEPHPSGNFLVLILSLFQPVLILPVSIAGFALMAASLPSVPFAMVVSGKALLSRDPERIKGAVMGVTAGIGVFVLFGLALRGIHMLTLAEAGC